MQELISQMSYGITNPIRQDSCRSCGNEVQAINFCQVCDKPIQFQCQECDQFLDEQIHFVCENAKNLREFL